MLLHPRLPCGLFVLLCSPFLFLIYSFFSLYLHVRNEEVLLTVKEQRNILHEIRKRKANWIGHILRRNYVLQRVIEEKIQWGIEVTERQEIRRRKLLDDLKERRGYSHLKKEALDRIMWRARFGRGFGPVVRQTTKWMNEIPALMVLRRLVCLRNSQLRFSLNRRITCKPWRNSTWRIWRVMRVSQMTESWLIFWT
jgi:hypothetical protein